MACVLHQLKHLRHFCFFRSTAVGLDKWRREYRSSDHPIFDPCLVLHLDDIAKSFVLTRRTALPAAVLDTCIKRTECRKRVLQLRHALRRCHQKKTKHAPVHEPLDNGVTCLTMPIKCPAFTAYIAPTVLLHQPQASQRAAHPICQAQSRARSGLSRNLVEFQTCWRWLRRLEQARVWNGETWACNRGELCRTAGTTCTHCQRKQVRACLPEFLKSILRRTRPRSSDPPTSCPLIVCSTNPHPL